MAVDALVRAAWCAIEGCRGRHDVVSFSPFVAKLTASTVIANNLTFGSL